MTSAVCCLHGWQALPRVSAPHFGDVEAEATLSALLSRLVRCGELWVSAFSEVQVLLERSADDMFLSRHKV